MCTCNIGFSGNGSYCENVDECQSSSNNSCHENATCTDSVGSYSCACKNGFSGNATYCNGNMNISWMLEK